MTIETPKEPMTEEQKDVAEGMLDALAAVDQPVVEDPPTEEIQPPVNDEPKAENEKPTEEPPAPTEDEAKNNAELEAEMDSLGLKERSRTRFQALTRENTELRPLKAALEAAGLKDAADIPRLIERAEAGMVFENAIKATGAPPSDFSQALNVLSDLNSNDPLRQVRGFEVLSAVVKHWAPILGRQAEGVDPLVNHPDLADAVEAGELTQAHALELAANRSVKQLQEASVQRESQQSQEQQAYQQEEQTARERLTALGNELATKDPHYQAKFPALKAALVAIMEHTPPAQWELAAYRAYQNLPNPTAPAPTPAPAHRPLRANAVRETVVPEFTDPLKAMLAGIASANGEVA